MIDAIAAAAARLLSIRRIHAPACAATPQAAPGSLRSRICRSVISHLPAIVPPPRAAAKAGHEASVASRTPTESLCEHLFVTSQGSATTRYRRAIEAKSVLLAELSAREMGLVPLGGRPITRHALRFCGLAQG